MKENYWVIKNEALNPNNVEISNDYLLSLKLAKKSEQTVDKYRRYHEKFWLDNPKNLEDIEPDEVHDWFNKNYGLMKATTYDFVFDVLSGFFKFCLNEGTLDKILIKKRWRRKLPYTIPKYLTPEELAKLKIQLDKMSLRDRALIIFLLSSGCRRGETAALNWEDIDLENRIAMVTGKGKKVREVFFSEEATVHLKAYLEQQPNQKGAVFLNKHFERLRPLGLYQIVRKAGRKAGLAKGLFCHRCRHSFATYLLARGATLEFIAGALGHNDQNTTRIYSGVLSEDLNRLYIKYKE